MSLATASCDLWQNEQRSVSSGVLGFTIELLGPVGSQVLSGQRPAWYGIGALLVLVNDIVDDTVFLGLLGVHNEIPLHVLLHLFQLLPGMLGNQLAGDLPHTQYLSCMYIN